MQYMHNQIPQIMSCSAIKGSMYKVMKSFICRGCMNPVTGTGCTSVDIGGDANLENSCCMEMRPGL